jgi:acyl carrier protein
VAPAVTSPQAGGLVELSGTLRVLDAEQRTVVELQGSLRVAQPGGSGAVAPVPAPVRAEVPVAQPQPAAPALSAESVLSKLIEYVAAITRVPAATVDPGKRTKDLGMDSLMATQLRKRVQAELGVALANRSVLNAPSLRAIADEVFSAVSNG